MNKYLFLSLFFILSSCASSDAVKVLGGSKHDHICQVIAKYPDASIVGGSSASFLEQLELFYSLQEDETNSSSLKVDSINGDLIGTLPSDILFEFDKYELLISHQAIIDTFVLPLINTDNPKTISIVGHTDNVGSEQYNIVLSKHRADAVRNYIGSKYPGALISSTYGLGESSPIATNETPEGRAKNRRVELIIHND